jgi:recombination protein RecR
MIPDRLARLMSWLARLPGVGSKTAQRFALHLVAHPELIEGLARELSGLSDVLRNCERCNNLAEVHDGHALCGICSDTRRDARIVCIVERVQDLLAIEKSSAMRGRYFVLGRLLSPLEGVAAEDLPLPQLYRLLDEQPASEVILATPASVEGEATALFLARELARRGIGVSRIASGIPHGGDLEYLDQITLGRAIDGRRRVD